MRILEILSKYFSKFTKEFEKFFDNGLDFQQNNSKKWRNVFKIFVFSIEWLTENEETGKEKKLSTFVLVRSKDISSSIRTMEDFYKELAQDYSIVGITEKNYIDILK